MWCDEPDSDAEIIEDSLEKPELFGVIFERHYRDIHRFLVAAVGSSDGPDLAAEVFLRAFSSRHRYRLSYPSARPWL
jgi:RNA polymerase sigma-70 factor (ECF subfamily)